MTTNRIDVRTFIWASSLSLLVLLAHAAHLGAQTFTDQHSGSKASLRGVAAVSDRIAWASGSHGTVLRTLDGGATWTRRVVPNTEELDFRGVVARSANEAWLMSSGPGAKSNVFHTVDGGVTWRLQLRNPDANGFFDGIAFWDARHGLILGDPVEGSFVVLATSDGGNTWRRQRLPPALKDEGSFAASNTALVLRGEAEAWFGTGGARVFRTQDRGEHWTVAIAPLVHDAPGAGIFSLAFPDAQRGIAVGGNYTKAEAMAENIALSDDGGRSWKAAVAKAPRGYRSAVACAAQVALCITAGPNGAESSRDNGHTWTPIANGSLNAISLLANGTGWGVGSNGRIVAVR